MATNKIDHYAGFRYEIVTPEELREANWLISQGFFKDMDDYITCLTRAELKGMKEDDAARKIKAENRRLKRADLARKHAA